MTERLLDVREVAKILGVSVITVRRLYWRREITVVEIGRRKLFDEADVRAYIDAKRSAAGSRESG